MNPALTKILDGALYAIGFCIIWNLPKIIAFATKATGQAQG